MLANPRIEKREGGSVFVVDITRAVEASVYGDVLVYRQGEDEPAFVARGIGVYPEIASRHAAFGISPEQATALRGPIRVELRQPLQNGAALITAVDAVLR